MTSATPKRVTSRLELTIEDIAAAGTANFEAALRQNVSLAISAELDDQLINGDGAAPNITGMFQRLADPAAPGAGVADFDDFIALFASGIDGLWSTMESEVGIVVNQETYRLAAQTFRDAAGQDLGDQSFAAYARENFADFWCNSRMPAKAAHIAQGILCRKGRSAMGASEAMLTAVAPTWGSVAISDVYSGSGKGEQYFTLAVLIGDLILVQSEAYAQVAVRVSVP